MTFSSSDSVLRVFFFRSFSLEIIISIHTRTHAKFEKHTYYIPILLAKKLVNSNSNLKFIYSLLFLYSRWRFSAFLCVLYAMHIIYSLRFTAREQENAAAVCHFSFCFIVFFKHLYYFSIWTRRTCDELTTKKGTQCASEYFDWRFVYFTQTRIHQSHHKCNIAERARACATDDNEGKPKPFV